MDLLIQVRRAIPNTDPGRRQIDVEACSVPVGALALMLALLGLPKDFPYRREDSTRKPLSATLGAGIRALDIQGSILLLLAVLSFTACFMEAGSRFEWNSAYVITLLVVSALLWSALLVWERHVTTSHNAREPVLPWRFFQNRVMAGILLAMALVGGPATVSIFQVPQRFQLVNGLSNIDAGVRVIPFGGLFPVGSIVGSTLASKLRVPTIYLAMAGSAFQVVGYAFLSTLKASLHVDPAIYGYLVLCGFGSGMSYMMLWVTVPFAVEKRDEAVGMGAANQFRVMGSAIGLAIATSVFDGYVEPRLAGIGIIDPVDQLTNVGLGSVSQSVKDQARLTLSEGYNRQMLVLCALSAAQIPAALLMWKRKQIVPA